MRLRSHSRRDEDQARHNADSESQQPEMSTFEQLVADAQQPTDGVSEAGSTQSAMFAEPLEEAGLPRGQDSNFLRRRRRALQAHQERQEREAKEREDQEILLNEFFATMVQSAWIDKVSPRVQQYIDSLPDAPPTPQTTRALRHGLEAEVQRLSRQESPDSDELDHRNTSPLASAHVPLADPPRDNRIAGMAPRTAPIPTRDAHPSAHMPARRTPRAQPDNEDEEKEESDVNSLGSDGEEETDDEEESDGDDSVIQQPMVYDIESDEEPVEDFAEEAPPLAGEAPQDTADVADAPPASARRDTPPQHSAERPEHPSQRKGEGASKEELKAHKQKDHQGKAKRRAAVEAKAPKISSSHSSAHSSSTDEEDCMWVEEETRGSEQSSGDRAPRSDKKWAPRAHKE